MDHLLFFADDGLDHPLGLGGTPYRSVMRRPWFPSLGKAPFHHPARPRGNPLLEGITALKAHVRLGAKPRLCMAAWGIDNH